MSGARELVKELIYEFLVHGDKYGMGSSEGLYGRQLFVLPPNVKSIDELIEYGTEVIDGITDEKVIDNLDSDFWGCEWDEMIINSDIWYVSLKKIIPSIGCITGDGSEVRILEDIILDHCIDGGAISKSLPIDVVNKVLSLKENE